MGFLSGPVTFDGFRVGGSQPKQFGLEHVKVLEKFAIGRIETASTDEADVGFLGGAHLLDNDFDLEKNVIGDALHAAVRIDTNQIPAAMRKAWLQMELAVLAANNSSGRPTKAQRLEARETVEARCEEEAQSGKYRKMKQFPLLWDARESLLYFGGSSTGAIDEFIDLCARSFDLELDRLTSGKRAAEWAAETKQRKLLDAVVPAVLHKGAPSAEISWWNGEAGNFDFLGNEFLLWLWWRWETESDTIALPDDSEVTGMIARTLSLECPRGESGKETITAEAPAKLPEAAQGIRSGKLPRKCGLILSRHGAQYELVLQAETFSVSGAKIVTQDSDGTAEGQGILEDRIERVRELHETLDLLFRAFCMRRIGKNWAAELEKIRRWLQQPGK